MKRFLLLFCLSYARILAVEEDILSAQKRVAPALTQLISDAPEVEMLSLDPHIEVDKDGKKIEPPADKNIQGWLITGRATTTNRTEIAAIADSLRTGIEESPDYPAFCFKPRHALRIRRGEGDLVVIVCFQCLQGHVEGFTPLPSFITTKSPEKQWDSIFGKHGLQKAK